jgi:hypothetical protein
MADQERALLRPWEPASASPTWRDTSFALVLLSGFYLLLTALASYALGGNFAGRMRRPHAAAENFEYEDGMHGLLVWGLATLLTGLVAVTTVSLLPRKSGIAMPHCGKSSRSPRQLMPQPSVAGALKAVRK